MTTLSLAFLDLVGLATPFAHQVVWCMIGTGTVVVLGKLGNLIGGPQVGLVAATVAALYPYLWMNDPLVSSETLEQFLVACVLYSTYRVLQGPNLAWACSLSVSLSIAILTRSEYTLLVILLLVPAGFVLWHIEKRTIALALVGMSALVLAPWIIYSLTSFQRPEFVATDLGETLIQANCPADYYSVAIGFYSLEAQCLPYTYPLTVKVPKATLDRAAKGAFPKLHHDPADLAYAKSLYTYARKSPRYFPYLNLSTFRTFVASSARMYLQTDESVQDHYWQGQAISYASRNASRVPLVVLARLANTFGIYQQGYAVQADSYSGRPIWGSEIGMVMYYVLVVASVAGLADLRRRTRIWPLLAPIIVVAVSVALTYGLIRFRSGAEPSIVLLGSFGIVAYSKSLRQRLGRVSLKGLTRLAFGVEELD